MSDYFNINAILAEEEKVGVNFKVGCTGLGRALDPSCDDDDLKEGAELELPFWLTKELATRGMLQLKNPTYYSQRVKNDLQADPRCVNLAELCPFFYEVGLRILSMTNDRRLAEFIRSTFQIRYQQLLIQSLSVQPNTSQMDTVHRVLSKEEIKVFDAGRASKHMLQEWHNFPSSSSGMKKRKK
mmetsp:Transcript_17788/g.24598  ORF Transcript_17788/g.24598 Transcript_17788/m.24598 type:complete len:184 (-) Transcript_17788:152-703(-)